MKKAISILLTLCIFISIHTFLFVPTIANATSQNEYINSENNSFLYVNKKFILTSKKGIYFKKSAKGKSKKLTGKKVANNFISNGKTIYFTYDMGYAGAGHQRYAVYSIKNHRKSLKKLFTGNIEISLVALYKNCIYYLDNDVVGGIFPTCLYKYNLKTKKKSLIIGNNRCPRAFYHKGKIYYSNLLVDTPEINYTHLYSLNLKNNKIKKIQNNAEAIDYCSSSNIACFESNKWNRNTDNACNIFVYTINNKNKLTKSKKLPNNSILRHVNKKGTKAIYSKGYSSDYRIFNLKSGKNNRIQGIGNPYYSIITEDAKSSIIYFVNISKSNKMTIKKLVGNKLKAVKLSGKSSIKVSSRLFKCWIVGKYAIINNNNNYKTYKIS